MSGTMEAKVDPAEHMPLAMKLAGEYAREHRVPVDDMLSAAYLALCRAAKGFDPTRGFAFSTYAYRSICRALHHEVMTQHRGYIGTHGRLRRPPMRRVHIDLHSDRQAVHAQRTDRSESRTQHQARQLARGLTESFAHDRQISEIVQLFGRGLNQQQIYRALGVSRGTVFTRVRTMRAVAAAQRAMEKCDEESKKEC